MTLNRSQLRKTINKARLERLLGKFITNPPSIISYKANNKGKFNQVYFLNTTDKPLVLHILNPLTNMGFQRTNEDLNYTVSFENAVKAKGVPVPFRYLTPEGQPFVVEPFGDADYFVTLQEFIAGQHYRKLNAEQLKVLGTTVSSIHKAVKIIPPTSLQSRSWSVTTAISMLSGQDSESRITGKNLILESYLREFNSITKEARAFIAERITGFLKHPVHQDINGPNLLFQENRLKAILDFDNSHDDYFFEDLATPLLNHCTFTSPELTAQAAFYFLDGYTQNYSFAVLELELSLYAWLAFRAWFAANTLRSGLENNSFDPNKLGIEAKTSRAKIHCIQKFIKQNI